MENAIAVRGGSKGILDRARIVPIEDEMLRAMTTGRMIGIPMDGR